MAVWICGQCGEEFKRAKSGTRPIRFCKPECYHLWQKTHPNAGSFRRGLIPWNKGVKGIHLSPDTEFKPGHVSTKRCPIGTTRVRVFRKDGELHSARAFVKVAQPDVWKLRSHVMWEKAHGPIPKGMLLHYKNDDEMDDRLSNFALLTRAKHLATHRPQFEGKRRTRCGEVTRRRWARYREAQMLNDPRMGTNVPKMSTESKA